MMLNQILQYKKWATWIFLILVSVFYTSLLSNASPQLATNAKAGDCIACHGAQEVLSESHPPTADMTYENCVMCHAKDSNNTLLGKMTGFHLHQLQGVSCIGCHGDVKEQEEVFHDQCMTCHEPEKLATSTANSKPKNPHDSPHYGKENDCTLCHRQHEPSVDMCVQCHTFDFKVP